MATEQLSLRLAPELMASVRDLAEKRQVSVTMAATTLMNTGLTAEMTSALLNSQLAAAQADIARLKKAASRTFSPQSSETKVDWAKINRERQAARDEQERQRQAASEQVMDINDPAPGAAGARPSVSCYRPYKTDDPIGAPYRSVLSTEAKIEAVKREIGFRAKIAAGGLVVGATLLFVTLVLTPYSSWFPRLIAEIAMGRTGHPEAAAERLHGGPLRAGESLLAIYTVMHTGSNPKRLAACFNAANRRFGYHAFGTIICEIEIPGPVNQYDLMTSPAPDNAPLSLVDKETQVRSPANKGKR